MTEFLPTNNIDLMKYENTFLYEDIISEELVNQIIKIYKSDMR